MSAFIVTGSINTTNVDLNAVKMWQLCNRALHDVSCGILSKGDCIENFSYILRCIHTQQIQWQYFHHNTVGCGGESKGAGPSCKANTYLSFVLCFCHNKPCGYVKNYGIHKLPTFNYQSYQLIQTVPVLERIPI